MKRHRNIHEKYGRTKPNPPPATSAEDTQTSNALTESVNAVASVTTPDDNEHEEIMEAKYEEKYVPSDEITEEMADISELQVQLA